MCVDNYACGPKPDIDWDRILLAVLEKGRQRKAIREEADQCLWAEELEHRDFLQRFKHDKGACWQLKVVKRQ